MTSDHANVEDAITCLGTEKWSLEESGVTAPSAPASRLHSSRTRGLDQVQSEAAGPVDKSIQLATDLSGTKRNMSASDLSQIHLESETNTNSGLVKGDRGITIGCNLKRSRSSDLDELHCSQSAHSLLAAVRQPGAVLSFHDISYKVAGRTRRCGRAQVEDNIILHQVSGVFCPGLNAIMGPTGSGKTSLLDVLAARKGRRGLDGKVLVDGAPQPDNFKCMSGYVIQADTVMGMLTVRENIQFSAALRLGNSVTPEKQKQRVDEVIEDLGLQKCADSKVGTELRRGVSGGEKKRLSIAMELLTSPSILFLDEPTTGLDANTALNVMFSLKRLSQQGRTVILSIHQPRYAIYQLLDKLSLLNGGHCVYHGPANQALDFFENAGYICEPHNNPPDFFLDVLSGNLMPTTETKDKTVVANGTKTFSVASTLSLDIDPDEVTLKQTRLVEMYHSSKWYKRTKGELQPLWSSYEQQHIETTSQGVAYPTSFLTQLQVVCARTFRNMIRNPHTLMTQVLAAMILGIIVGTIYFQVDDSFSSGIQNRVGAFFFIAMNHVFGNMAAVDLFINERALFIHENVSGFYRMSVYFLAKVLCDVLPMRAIPISVFSLISYWMIGLKPSTAAFFFYILTIFNTSLAGTSVALLLSSTVNNHAVGTILTSLVWVIMMVFGGLLVNLASLPPWLQWVRFTSIFSYSMNALTVNELKGLQLCDKSVNVAGNITTTVCDHGDAYMTRQGIPHTTVWDLWLNQVALVIITGIFLTFSYVQLRRINKFT